MQILIYVLIVIIGIVLYVRQFNITNLYRKESGLTAFTRSQFDDYIRDQRNWILVFYIVPVFKKFKTPELISLKTSINSLTVISYLLLLLLLEFILF